MATIRELFHSLGNMHNMLTVGAGVSKEMLKKCLGEERGISAGLKDKLNKILKNLDRLITDTVEADKKTREIHDRVYAVVNPDTGEAKENGKKGE